LPTALQQHNIFQRVSYDQIALIFLYKFSMNRMPL
jgi:hypothetical protein